MALRVAVIVVVVVVEDGVSRAHVLTTMICTATHPVALFMTLTIPVQRTHRPALQRRSGSATLAVSPSSLSLRYVLPTLVLY